ncbi:MAG: YigZ family protein [Erysipelotrichaceae bacterium]|nr:YigZ family protein [Erysipelotrichaceae bacterium]
MIAMSRKVPLSPSLGEEKDLASTFVTGLFPLPSVEDFKTLYDQFKKDHPKADHYPYAYCLNGLSKSSDDGEPGGSAGRPMMSLLEDKEIDGVLIVARYFGGSKLGIPRLRRAFLYSAENAIQNARLGAYSDVFVYPIEVSYSEYEILRSHAKRLSFSLEKVEFAINVRAEIHSGARLTGFGEAVGLFDLVLPEPEIRHVLQEVKP